MPFIAGVMTIGPYVAQSRPYAVADPGYHNALAALNAAMGVTLPAQQKLERWIHACLDRYAASTPKGQAGYGLLAQLYPEHMAALAAAPRVHLTLRSMAAQALEQVAVAGVEPRDRP